MDICNTHKTGEIIDLLNRCWMTHDGMWFLHCFQTLGIKQANLLNKAAIRSLAPMEVGRLRRFLGNEEQRITGLADLEEFFISTKNLLIPDFMGVTMTFLEKNVVHWEFEQQNCFAYKGIKRIGAIEGYECGVIYRLECWLETLGLKFRTSPKPVQCLMHQNGTCSGNFEIFFDPL